MIEMTDAMRRCLHRPPALRQPHANDHKPQPAIPDAGPELDQAQQPLAAVGGEAKGDSRPLVCFVLRRVRLLDVDAKYASIKDLLDGLAHAGLIRGDKESEVRLEVRQEKVASFKAETTEIVIVYPND